MSTLLTEHLRTARKEHECMACLWLEYLDDLYDLTFAEKRAIVLAKQNNWRIKPGQQYLDQRIANEDGVYTFKAIPAIDQICQKYDLYEYY